MKEIQITVNPGENFTPAGLMKRYADQTAGAVFGRDFLSNSLLTIEGTDYQYHHWSITRTEGADVVTLHLCELNRYNGLNPMCQNCLKLDQGCEGTTCRTWTGCAMKERAEA